jgi:hypothetical protein
VRLAKNVQMTAIAKPLATKSLVRLAVILTVVASTVMFGPVAEAAVAGESAGMQSVVVQSAEPGPAGATLIGAVADQTPVDLDLVLKPLQPAALSAFLQAVSTPGSSEFRRFITPRQFGSQFGPTAATVSRVVTTLQQMGLSVGQLSANRLLLPVSGTAAQVGTALHVRLILYRWEGSVEFGESGSPALPASIASSVQAVEGLADAQVSTPGLTLLPATQESSGCYRPPSGKYPGYWTAAQLSKAYDITPLRTAGFNSGDPGGEETVALFEWQPPAPSDVSTFESCVGKSQVTPTVITTGNAPTSCSGGGCDEPDADVETILSLIPDVHGLDVYSVPTVDSGGGVHPSNADIVKVWNGIATGDDPIVSTSDDVCENQPLSSGEEPIFEEMAAQGQTVFAATGDQGSESQGCYTSGQEFPQMWDPASQPTVTAVGGTELDSLGSPPTSVGAAPVQVPKETVWNDRLFHNVVCPCTYGDTNGGAGGGGESTIWPMPSYQEQYGVNGQPCGDCRTVPDVSASADPFHGYLTYIGGTWEVSSEEGGNHGEGGTSLATPLWASIIALAENSCDARFGMINPSLYSIGESSSYGTDFDDISAPSGSNNDWTGQMGGQYPVEAGYDLATGLGAPVSANLAASLCSEPFRFVDTVSISGGTAKGSGFGASITQGAYGAPGTDNGTGAVYAATGESSSLQQIVAPNGSAGDHFGASIAGIGNVQLLIGAPGHGGSAYFYANNGSTGQVLLQEFSAPSTNSKVAFGAAVSLAEDSFLAIGAPGSSGASGATYVYAQSSNGWVLLTKLSAPKGADDGGAFGTTVALDGSELVVGDPGAEMSSGLSERGAVFVYTLNSSKAKLVQTLLPADGVTGGQYGSSLSLDDVLVVGASESQYIAGGGDTGAAAYIYSSSGSPSTWGLETEVTALALGAPSPVSVTAFPVPYPCGPDDVALGVPSFRAGPDSETYGEVNVYAPGSGGYQLATTLLDPEQADIADGASDNFGASVLGVGGSLDVGSPAYNNPRMDGGTVGGIVDVFGALDECP